jgi:hypothetical protein
VGDAEGGEAEAGAEVVAEAEADLRKACVLSWKRRRTEGRQEKVRLSMEEGDRYYLARELGYSSHGRVLLLMLKLKLKLIQVPLAARNGPILHHPLLCCRGGTRLPCTVVGRGGVGAGLHESCSGHRHRSL